MGESGAQPGVQDPREWDQEIHQAKTQREARIKGPRAGWKERKWNQRRSKHPETARAEESRDLNCPESGARAQKGPQVQQEP